MVYDITCRSSFENVEGWLSELRQHSDGDMVVVLVAKQFLFRVVDRKQVRSCQSAEHFYR